MNNPNHISERSLETILLKIVLKFLDVDPGWIQFGSGILVGKKSDQG